jgi:septum formation protein
MPSILPLILASTSPRRRQLLKEAGFVFETMSPSENAEDERQLNETPAEYVRRLAFQKANNVAERVAQGIILGGDTIVVCGEHILEKPVDKNDARRMLQQLRGHVHQVVSGLCLIKKESHRPEGAGTLYRECQTETTLLLMQPISDTDLEAYLATDKWQGKAGAFGYQDGNDWLAILEGNESNVVGLPMELFRAMLCRVDA